MDEPVLKAVISKIMHHNQSHAKPVKKNSFRGLTSVVASFETFSLPPRGAVMKFKTNHSRTAGAKGYYSL